MENERKDINPEIEEEEVTPDWQPQRIAISDDESERIMKEATARVYARSVKGRFDRARQVMVYLTQFVFLILPWFNWNGRQAFWLDIINRKFYLGPMVLSSQDVLYLAIILIISAYGLFLVTALAGRVFCGYACPQTVYTEIFMWIEKHIEGDRVKRMKLDESPWTGRKILLRYSKYLAWGLFSLWCGLSLVGWFLPIREVFPRFFQLDLSFWPYFWTFFYGTIMFLFAGLLRENVCKYMCPYARFQSVMIDKDTIIVTYDQKRGEPRGKRKKGADYKAQGLGDCIDCTMCVQVCPTGIDIRNGLQYMCIGCGACIDACDEVMDKVNYPRGLIRYTSEYGVNNGLSFKEVRHRFYRPRIYIYMTLLALLVGGLFYSLYSHNPVKVDIVRDRGSLGREVKGGFIENVYRIQVSNMTTEPRVFTVSADQEILPGATVYLQHRRGFAQKGKDDKLTEAQKKRNENLNSDSRVVVEPLESKWVPLVIRVPGENLTRGQSYDFDVKVESLSEELGDLEADHETSFYAPK